MRRSRSVSSIPVPKLKVAGGDRDSRHKFPGTSQPKVSLPRRSRSVEKQGRPQSSLFVRQNSNCYLRPSKCVTPMSGQRSPISFSSSGKKPPMDDRKWRKDNLMKVRRFFDEFTSFDTTLIKPGLSIDQFIQLVNFLLQHIEPKLNLTKDKYIEEIPRYLKILNYHTQVKPSLLKTVNTPHAWPQTLAILVALVDWITIGKDPNNYLYPRAIDETTKYLHEVLFLKTVAAFEAFNKRGDHQHYIDSLIADLEVGGGFDDDEFNRVKEKHAKLRSEYDKLDAKWKQTTAEIEATKARTKEKQQSVDKYSRERETFLKKTETAIEVQKQKNRGLADTIKVIEQKEQQLQSVIAAQKYSQTDKAKIQENIRTLEHTAALVEARVSEQRELISSYDFKLMEVKQNVEKAAYQYNNKIMGLGLINDEVKDLVIREAGFARIDVLQELADAKVRLMQFEEKLKQYYQGAAKELNTSTLEETIAIKRDKLNKLKPMEEKLKLELNNIQEQYEREIAELTKVRDEQFTILMKLESNKSASIEELENKLRELEDTNDMLRKKKNEIQKKGDNFLLELRKIFLNNFIRYMGGLHDLVQKVKAMLVENEKKHCEFLAKIEVEEQQLQLDLEKQLKIIVDNIDKNDKC